MKQLCFIFITLMYSYTVNAQKSVNDYIGTWRGEKGDTIFTVKLLEGEVLYKGKIINLLGGYSITVKGKLIDNYLNINTYRTLGKTGAEQKIYIDASYFMPPRQYVGFTFYDQQKKHFKGKGITGGVMRYIAPDKLHWTLDEKQGIWNKTEGNEDAGKVKPIGFSVPSNIILKKITQ